MSTKNYMKIHQALMSLIPGLQNMLTAWITSIVMPRNLNAHSRMLGCSTSVKASLASNNEHFQISYMRYIYLLVSHSPLIVLTH